MASNVFTAYVVNEVVTGREAKKDSKVISDKVGDHNEDLKVIEKDSVNVVEKQTEHKKRLDDIPLVVFDKPGACDCSELERVYNEANRLANSVRFED